MRRELPMSLAPILYNVTLRVRDKKPESSQTKDDRKA